jgi:hypothetical protein
MSKMPVRVIGIIIANAMKMIRLQVRVVCILALAMALAYF